MNYCRNNQLDYKIVYNTITQWANSSTHINVEAPVPLLPDLHGEPVVVAPQVLHRHLHPLDGVVTQGSPHAEVSPVDHLTGRTITDLR